MIALRLVLLFMIGYCHAVIKCPYFCSCDKWQSFRRVVCTSQHLASTEINAPSEVQALDLSRNSISELRSKAFYHIHQLRYLNVSYNKITDIHINAFYGLNVLNIMDLSRNHLKYLLPFPFEDTPELQELYLSGNQIGHFGKPPMFQIPSLQILHMRECWLDSMDEVTFSHLPNLIDLDLSYNQFVDLKAEYLRSLTDLNSLHLEGNLIEEVVMQLRERNVIVAAICENSSKIEIFANPSEMLGKFISITDDSESNEDDPDSIETLSKDISRIWFGDKGIAGISEDEHIQEVEEEKKRGNAIEEFMEQIPSMWAFILGLQMGAVLAIIGMWVWLRCKCSQVPAQPPMRTRSLSVTQSLRRSVGRHRSDDSYTELESVDCPGTPPPPYRDVA